MDTCSSIIYLISRLYFFVVTVVFYVVNIFKTKQVVPPISDDLLLISATEAVKRIVKRKVNDVINTVVVRLFDEATKKAAEIDREIAEMGNERLEQRVRSKPLLGVPFTVKDALEVDGQIITCGIYNHRDNKCTQSAEVIKRMEAAGAILIAITNVPEACSWVESTNGIYGLSKNPYDTRLSVGGSSGGEGALISAAGSLIGIGSDIGGSIRIPSFMNGIFGMKPTPGVIPLDGHVPMPKEFQIQMLRIGPMCRYVEDVPLLMEVMGGELAVDLHLKGMVDFKKVRFFYMEGIQHTPKPQSLSSEMRCALLKVRAVSYFEQKFDVEGIRLDLPLASNAIEMLFSCIQAKNTPTISESFKSLKGDRGSLNWMTELPKLLAGKSVHTAAALFLSFFESMDRTSEKEKAKRLDCPRSTYNSVCVARITSDLNQKKRLRRKWCPQPKRDRQKEWTSRAKKFERAFEDMNPKKSSALLRQYSGKMERRSPLLNTVNGVVLGEPTFLKETSQHFVDQKRHQFLNSSMSNDRDGRFGLFQWDGMTNIICSTWFDEMIPDS
ncbi:hypothetical protein RB195_005419 [Necator americanus]|uniref:Amidase domain-containing protein n=1 Tax=Necator americanus TaxID=51031 RepID=A0ABR1BMR2_NECAM